MTAVVCLLLLAFSHVYGQEKTEIEKRKFTGNLQRAIAEISLDRLGTQKGDVTIKQVNNNTAHVRIKFELTDSITQDDWQIQIKPAFKPTFNWAPHLTPTDKNIIAQHVFRSPALIVSNNERVLILIPDLDLINKNPGIDWYMDMDAPQNILSLGMSNSRITEHVLFERTGGAVYPEGYLEFGFYIMSYSDQPTIENPFRRTASFFWERWGSRLFATGDPASGDLQAYVDHTYTWAFESWKDEVWQQFRLNGKQVGAPVFIVNVTQSPNYPGEVHEREFRSIWNQAWFSSLRSASGLYRYGRRTNNKELLEKALLTKELALNFPKKQGFFWGLIGTDMEMIEIEGQKYARSLGWDHFYWGNSNRNPYTGDPRKSPFHILDMSWTSLLMLRWYDELEKDKRLLSYAEDYAKSLLKMQDENGFFPAWLDVESLKPLPHLEQSPETSLSVTFLLTLYQITGKNMYKTAALKAMNAVTKKIIRAGQWEDFETYWSCSRIGSQDWVGRKVKRNNMFKQNNFSMFWTAEALLECYQLTKDKKYLSLGQRTLDELLMTQASWQPYFIPVKTLGGFGVLNADGEWNDARQSLFAELIIQYGLTLNSREYLQRGLAAMRASFIMMYCPENPQTKKQWEKVWPFFGKEDYGFMMENFGHGGEANEEGLGIGEFTIYDWGNGAASEAYNRLLDHYGLEFVTGSGERRSGGLIE